MNKNLKTIIVVGLIAIVATLSIAYATLSQTLNVTGTAQVTGNTWTIGMTKPTTPCVASGKATAGTVAISGTTATISGVVLSVPGDSVTCTVEVVNTGTVDAKLTAFSKKTPTITGTSTTASDDAKIITDNHTYSVTYTGSTNPTITETSSPTLNTTYLNKTTGKALVKVTFTFNSGAVSVPKNPVNIGNMGVTLTYQQK